MAGDYFVYPPRFSKVPWLRDQSDLRPMGPAETIIEEPGQITHGLLIPDPFGKETAAMLSVRAKRGNGNDGGEITLAIKKTLVFELPRIVKPTGMRLELNINPSIFPDSNGANDPDGD